MGDKVFVNGLAAVHSGSSGQSIAFPDVCLCPPTPPAGPIPTPLPNTVVARDLTGGARTVLIEGNPAGKLSSSFAKSTGNEVSRPTGGGVVSHAVQGKARFVTHSLNVFFEGEPAVRHLDLLTHNHLAGPPGNTPPAPWLSTMNLPARGNGPKRLTTSAGDGDDWIGVELVDETGDVVAWTPFEVTTPKGTRLEGEVIAGGTLRVLRLAKGTCKLVLPEVDDINREANRTDPGAPLPSTVIYAPGEPLALETGKAHKVTVPGMKTFWLDFPLQAREVAGRADRYTLRSSDGRYEVTRALGEDRIPGDRRLTLEYPALIKGAKYTLTQEYGDSGQVRTIFADRPFEELFPENPPEGDEPEEVVHRLEASPETNGDFTESGTSPDDLDDGEDGPVPEIE